MCYIASIITIIYYNNNSKLNYLKKYINIKNIVIDTKENGYLIKIFLIKNSRQFNVSKMVDIINKILSAHRKINGSLWPSRTPIYANMLSYYYMYSRQL